jgi:flagellar biosynthetic protein FliR
MTLAYLYAWIMIVLRSIGVINQLPVIAGHPLPVVARIGICVALATLLAGLIPIAPVPPDLWGLIVATAFEVILGFGIGFVIRVAFASIEMAGRVISSEIGLTATPGLGAPEPAQEPVASLMTTLAIVLFFLFGAHHGVLIAFAKSFQIAPAGGAGFAAVTGGALITDTARMIELGVRISAPFIAMNFLVNFAFSVLGKAVPRMNVFIVSFSARALFGLGLLSTAGALVARYMYVEFGDLPLRMLEIVGRR